MPSILIIDDSPTEVYELSRILKKHKHTVKVAKNGDEGLKMAKDIRPELILMDVVMPGVNGFQATRQLSRHEITKNIPVIIVSTKDQDTDKVWGMRQGARAYLVKPVTEAQLIKTVNDALAE
ncbi:MAG: twitching motility two-component system response regulator PilH [Cellvibrionaceae bacterium]|jgi:twitching motility two-component system response regulator PilH